MYHICGSKKYNKLVNKTKEADSPRERTNQWLPMGRGKGEWQHRVGENKQTNIIMGLYEIMCVKLLQIVKPS